MNFPEFELPIAPAHRFDSMPVFLEPMDGSGERIVVCAAAAGESGFAVDPLISERVAKCLYGAKARGFPGLIDMIADSLRIHLDGGAPLRTWQLPLSGATPGKIVPARADSARHAVAHVAVLHASLCQLPALAGVEDDETASDTDDTGLKAWVRQVQIHAAQLLPELELNRLVALGDGDSTTLHLATPDRAGLVGLITPENLGQRANDAKVKLWNLEHLPTEFRRRELVLGIPRNDAPNMADDIVQRRVHGKVDALRAQSRTSRSGTDQPHYSAHRPQCR